MKPPSWVALPPVTNSIRPRLTVPSSSVSTRLMAFASDWPWVSPPGHFWFWRAQFEVLSSTIRMRGLPLVPAEVPRKMSMSSAPAGSDRAARAPDSMTARARKVVVRNMAESFGSGGGAVVGDVVARDAHGHALGHFDAGFGFHVGGDRM